MGRDKNKYLGANRGFFPPVSKFLYLKPKRDYIFGSFYFFVFIYLSDKITDLNKVGIKLEYKKTFITWEKYVGCFEL